MTPFKKVIDFRTNGKRVCNFLLVNNTNLRRILQWYRYPVIAEYWSKLSNTLVLGELLNS